jgi:hypothetical protein
MSSRRQKATDVLGHVVPGDTSCAHTVGYSDRTVPGDIMMACKGKTLGGSENHNLWEQ